MSTTKTPVARAGLHALLLLGATVMIVPFLWLVSSSLKKPSEIFRQPPDLVPWLDEVLLEGTFVECERKAGFDAELEVRLDEGERHGELLKVHSGQFQGGRVTAPERGLVTATAATLLREVQPERIEVEILDEENPRHGNRMVVAATDLRRRVGLQWRNYATALGSFQFLRYTLNTLLLVLLNVLGVLLSSALAAYGFAKLRFPGREVLFLVLLSTMLLPGIVLLIPHFQMFKWLDLLDTYWPLTLPAFFGVPFYIFLLRQFFRTIPNDLSDAARIDGCSEFGIFWRVVLPLSKPALATIAIFTFMGVWNDLMGPLIYLFDMEKFTLALGLSTFKGEYSTKWHLLMASSAVMVVPVIVLFFTCQRFFIRGITMTGMKG